MKGFLQTVYKPWVWVLAGIFLLGFCFSFGMEDANYQASQTEMRIAQVLSTMKGVGKVEVVLYYQTSQNGLYDSNTQIPTGAIVVAEGADQMNVKLELIRAMQTLLSLPQSAVDVFAMEEKP